MTKTVTAALAAAAIIVAAGAAHADNHVCQWTGVDWACGNGNTVSMHASAAAGPPMIIKSYPTVPSNETPLLSGPRPQ